MNSTKLHSLHSNHISNHTMRNTRYKESSSVLSPNYPKANTKLKKIFHGKIPEEYKILNREVILYQSHKNQLQKENSPRHKQTPSIDYLSQIESHTNSAYQKNRRRNHSSL